MKKLIFLTMLLFSTPVFADGIDGYTVDQYVQAIYKTEGGDNAQYPYGIRSIKCDTKQACERIARNTVKNNIKRYLDYGKNKYPSYLEFLASRYAPIGVTNDPKNLNKNWLKNMRYFLSKGK